MFKLMSLKTVSVVIPVYNEEAILKPNVLKVENFLRANFNNYDWLIIISDSNSSDQTSAIAQDLARDNSRIKYFHLPEKGKGLAVMRAWQAFPAEINIFMDADLATDLEALPRLVKSIEEGNDLAIGSRHLPESEVNRPISRKVMSRVLSSFLNWYLGLKVESACGFKAISQKTLIEIVPQVENQGWVFDTELLFLAQNQEFRIKEIPVLWQEPESRKNRYAVLGVVNEYLREMSRLRKLI